MHINTAYSHTDTDTGVSQEDSAEYRDHGNVYQTKPLYYFDWIFSKSVTAMCLFTCSRHMKKRQHSSSKDAKNQLLSSSFFGEFDYLTDKTDDEFWRQSFQSVHHSDTFFLNLFWGNKTNSRFVKVEREDPSCRCMNSFATGRLSYIAD